MNEPARAVDVRVGSSNDALTPFSSAERSLAARPWQWLGLVAIAAAALAADQLTKLADLHDHGSITDDEYAREKAKVLAA